MCRVSNLQRGELVFYRCMGEWFEDVWVSVLKRWVSFFIEVGECFINVW